MMELVVLVLIGILTGVNAGYFYALAPNQLRFGQNEMVLVGVLDQTNTQVEIWLEHKGTRISHGSYQIVNERTPINAIVRIEEKDIFDDTTEDKPRTLKLVAVSGGIRKEVDVRISYNAGYLIVQTDKPIYTPRQEVKVRTLTLDESLKAASNWNVSMDIISPSNIIMGRKTRTTPNPFFKHAFKLPPNPETGIWTVRAYYKGQFETESRATFLVEEYVLPTFGVTIDVNTPAVLQDTRQITVTVKAEYVYKKPVNGKVWLNLFLKNKEEGTKDPISKMKKKMLSVDGTAEFIVDVEDDILNSDFLRNKDFPDGRHLQIDAYVYEIATGKEESTYHDQAIFAIDKYNVKFTRSKTTYRPGWEYILKIDLFYANGHNAGEERIQVRKYINTGEDVRNRVYTVTDTNGQVVLSHQTSNQETIEFEVLIEDVVIGQRHVVKPYVGTNQIQVEQVIKDNALTLRAFTNTQGGSAVYTGMMFVVVTRGQIVWHQFEEVSNSKSSTINEELQRIISPSARLIVFYVDKRTDEVVADSVKFQVEKKCRGNGLLLNTKKPTAFLKPGQADVLEITGSPLMAVGLNVIDKSLLLLNNKNVLRKNEMFEAFEKHDLGCGEGGGKTVEEVFKNTGLTMATNAAIASANLVRTSESCENQRRRKRSLKDCQAHQSCCDEGRIYAENFIARIATEQFDPYIECYSLAKVMALEDKLPIRCIIAYYKACKYTLDEHLAGTISSRSFDDTSDYLTDLNKLDSPPRVRSNFRESFLFEEILLSSEGKGEKHLPFPESITDWMIQAIGISDSQGMCIADPVNKTVFREFFIQLDLPYQAIRLEHIDVKATIFNYGIPGDQNKTANIYLDGRENLCSNISPGSKSPKTTLVLPPNSAQTVSFPMIPLQKGNFAVKVIAIVTDLGISESDAIEKKLHVVNEGTEVHETIHVCLDPLNHMKDCQNSPRVQAAPTTPGLEREKQYITVDLSPQRNVIMIPDTLSATANMTSNIMDDVVRKIVTGVDSMLRAPGGCAEQNMFRLAPTVYAMTYLKQSKQMTPTIEETGNRRIRDGVIHQYGKRQRGGFSYYNRAWLSSFVVKVFCQAKTIVDNAVQDEQITHTINWLTTRQNDDGSYSEPHSGYLNLRGNHKITTISRTAFVMTALLECPNRNANVNATIRSSMRYLEGLGDGMLRANPFVLAISSYALALADSTRKWHFWDLLKDIKHTDGENVFWGIPGNPANSESVETTAYALLTALLFDDLPESAHIVRWLTSQRTASGAFRSTQDTVVALQALSRYNIRTYSVDVDLNVKLSADDWPQGGNTVTLTNENSKLQDITTNLPAGKQLSVVVWGTGSGRMTIDLQYNRPATADENCPFNISEIQVKDVLPDDSNTDLLQIRKCDVCGYCENDPNPPDAVLRGGEGFRVEDQGFGRKKRQAEVKQSETCIQFTVRSQSSKTFGMSIVQFGLETGVSVLEEDLKKLVKETKYISDYEMPEDGKGFLILYLDQIGSDPLKIMFRITDGFEGDKHTRKPAVVNVYDYYNPEFKCAHLYGTGPSRGKPLDYNCGSSKFKKNCKCLQKIKEFIKQYKTNETSIDIFLAVIVNILSVNNDTNRIQNEATGTVVKVINKGIEALEKDSQMSFFWKRECDYPELSAGKLYYIIAKDGNVFTDENNAPVYRYPIMETAIVVEKYSNPSNNKEKQLNKILNNYGNTFAGDRGCAN